MQFVVVFIMDNFVQQNAPAHASTAENVLPDDEILPPSENEGEQGDPCIADPTALTNFWNKRSGTLARCAQFLIHVPVTSANVERSFSLAGYMDSKYRHSLPNNTRRTALMLMCNGDIEGRF